MEVLLAWLHIKSPRYANTTLAVLANLRVLFLDDNHLASIPKFLIEFCDAMNGSSPAAVDGQSGSVADKFAHGLSLMRSYNVNNAIDFAQRLNLNLLTLGEQNFVHGNKYSQFNPGACQIPFIAQNETLLDELRMISDNDLSAIPEQIGCLTALRELYLNNNQLTALPEQIGQLESLRELYLRDNELVFLPESIGNLCHLTTLTLSNNRLSVLPDSIGNLSCLQVLYLYTNQLTKLPETIGNMSSLYELGLSNNRLIVLPVSITKLLLLETLNVENNQLVTLPIMPCETLLGQNFLLNHPEQRPVLSSPFTPMPDSGNHVFRVHFHGETLTSIDKTLFAQRWPLFAHLELFQEGKSNMLNLAEFETLTMTAAWAILDFFQGKPIMLSSLSTDDWSAIYNSKERLHLPVPQADVLVAIAQVRGCL